MFGVWVPLALDVRSIKVEELGEKFDGRFSSYVNRFHERNDKSREELNIKILPDAQFTAEKYSGSTYHIRRCRKLGWTGVRTVPGE
jgi:hypothetical protein